MSFQSLSFNPMLHQRAGSAVKSEGIESKSVEIREVDLTYELWNILCLKPVSSRYFASDVPETFRLSDDVKLEERCSRFGRNFIPDLLKNCSDCRVQLRTIERFCNGGEQKFTSSKSVESVSRDLPSSLSSALLRPLRIVLKKFLEQSANKAQMEMTASPTLEMFNRYFIDFKPCVRKTYNFAMEILDFSIMNVMEEVPLQLVDCLWNKFLLGLNNSINLDDEFPLSEDFYAELINLLGPYFNIVCTRRQLLSYNNYSNTSRSEFGRDSSPQPMDEKFRNVRMTRDDRGDLTNGSDLSVHFFHLLLTPKLKGDLSQAFHFVRKIEQCGHAKLLGRKEKLFGEVFNSEAKETKLKEDFQLRGNPFKSLVEVLERSAEIYKSQFTDSIFNGIMSNGKLAVALAEIRELFTLRRFASTMSDFLDERNRPANMSDWMTSLENDITAVRSRFRNSASQNGAGNKWSIRVYESDRPWLFSLSCELEWPLSCLFDDALLGLLDKSFRSVQDLFHSYNMASNLMRKDKLGNVSMSLLARRKRMLGENLLDSVSVIYAVLRAAFESIIDEKSEQLMKCQSLVEMEAVITEWKKEFEKHLDYETFNRGSYIHAAVEGLSYLIEKFNAAENGVTFDHQTDATFMQSSNSLSPVSHSNGSLQAASNKKSARKMEKWIRAYSRVITVFSSASDPSGATFDPNSVGYAIGVLTPKKQAARR